MDKETQLMLERYAQREVKLQGAKLYEPVDFGNLLISQEKEVEFVKILRMLIRDKPLDEIRVLEIGCGDGSNLIQFMKLGILPHNISANEVNETRMRKTKERLPSAVTFYSSDALVEKFDGRKFDIVLVSTVMSSILDPQVRESLARHCMSLLDVHGGVLFYDFSRYQKTSNYIRPVTLSEVKKIFNGTIAYKKRVTLFHSLALRLGRVSYFMVKVLSSISILKTHWILFIRNSN